jgi:hypothetical protein
MGRHTRRGKERGKDRETKQRVTKLKLLPVKDIKVETEYERSPVFERQG